ncbi:MAG: AmmeMemoRadiSam system radical SAM enzyme, partial [Candidatus Omnitrophica bacterium]|nr:AmmeMemoRadiSam system radical SAM enzyme [Candidatus Omnitrophota bacterium]
MNTLQCQLCPKYCTITAGNRGACKIRYNRNGKLILLTYSRPCAIHIDPVEKKPLFHFSPGKDILSIATAGCNLHCKNCQNWQISQSNPEDIPSYKMGPEDIVSLARQKNCTMIAYTYTEPLAFYEYTLDISVLAKSFDLKNVLVTAGYCNEKPLKKLFRYIDAANVDLKFFNDAAYRKITSGTLKPVLDALVLAKQMDLWLEITHLIIPTINDNLSHI